LVEAGKVLFSGAAAILDLASKIVKPQQANLLGASEAEKKELDKWVKTFFSVYLPAFKEGDRGLTGKLHKFNKDLQTLTFLANNRLSIVDLLFLTLLEPTMREWKDNDRFTFMNITRWYDFVQHQDLVINTAIPINRNVPENWSEKPAEKPLQQQPTKAESSQQPTNQQQGKEEKQKSSKPEQPKEEKQQQPQPQKKQQKQQTQQQQPTEAKKAQGGGGGSKGASVKEEEKPVNISRLDIRIGKIVKVGKHPSADSLYVEEIDLGESTGVRQVVSGLVNFIPIEEMQNRYVVVLCNLKPATLRGVKSQAMVLAASDPEHTKVELLDPPHGSQIGERVFVEGYTGEPDEQLNPKHKVWETVQPEFGTSPECVATYKNAPFQTKAGVIRVKSIAGGSIK
jgi:methionine--tRNA ligase beta chain